MTSYRLLVLAALAAAAVSGCSSYKQVDDSSDGQNGKYKHHPAGLAR